MSKNRRCLRLKVIAQKLQMSVQLMSCVLVHVVPAQVWLSGSWPLPLPPPHSFKLQTLAARSREVIHCVRLRREEAASESTGRRSNCAP